MGKWFGNDTIFRTYCEGRNKRSKDKHKGKDLLSFEEASQYPSFGGILHPGIVDISFDDKEMGERFMDLAEEKEWRCLVLENPENGHIHTYWRMPKKRIKNGADKKLACGFIADIHSGDTYIPLKVNGIERFPPIYDIIDGEDYQEVPQELMVVNTNLELWNLAEGDNRNNTLYAYILVLQQNRLTPDEIKTMYREVINRYVLKSPLSGGELDVILRDESFDSELGLSFYGGSDGKKFLHEEMGKYLINKMHIIRISGHVYYYDEGLYKDDEIKIRTTMTRLQEDIRRSQKAEVMDYISLMSEDHESELDPKYIAFENGVYDIETDTLMNFTPDMIITSRIPHEYNGDSVSPVVDKVLDNISCHDPEIRQLLEECIGACMYRSALLAGGKAIILTGDGANGKSTYIDMVRAVLGQKNITSLDLKALEDRFKTAELVGKLCNAGDDISDEFLSGDKMAVFKKVVTGNTLTVERKGQDPFDFKPYCKLLFSANEIPRMKDRTGAVQRRLLIVPFNARFSSNDPDYDPEIITKLTTEESCQYLIRLGIAGLKRVLKNKKYTEGHEVQKALNEYEVVNNPVLGFIAEEGIEGIVNETIDAVYLRYVVFCQDNGIQCLSKISFGMLLTRKTHLKSKMTSINGKKFRIYVKGDENET